MTFDLSVVPGGLAGDAGMRPADCRKRCAHPLAPSARGLRPRSFPHKADHKKQVCPGGAANHYTFFTGYRTHVCLSRRACYTLSASVLHSGSQNRKKPVVGCHNRFSMFYSAAAQ